jgi:hypothetical protein
MSADNSSDRSRPRSGPGGRIEGLPRRVLEARARLGPAASPKQVADDVRAGGCPR